MRRVLPALLLLGIASSVMVLWLVPIPGAAAIHLAGQLPSTGTWVEVGSGSASGEGIGYGKFPDGGRASQSLALGTSGHPYVAWTYEKNVHHGQIYIKRFDGTDWVEVGPFSASFGVGISNTTGDSQWPSLALDDYDTPWVGWSEETSSDWEVYVKWFNGTDWVGWGSGGGISDTGDDSKHPSLALDSLGRPYVAWSERITTTQCIYIKRFDGTSWVEVGSGSASGGGVSNGPDGASYPALALDANNTPYLAWQDSSDGRLEIYVKRFDGSNWVEVGTGSASGGGVSNNVNNSRWPSIAIDSLGYPYVAWSYEDESWLPFPVDQIYIKRFNGANWVEVGTDSATGPGISASYYTCDTPSVALDDSDTPYVAWHYRDFPTNEQIYLKRFDGTGWVEVGGSASDGGISDTSGVGGSLTGYSRLPVLALDGSGIPYVAWAETTPSPRIYIRLLAPTWHIYLPLVCKR